MSTPVLNFWFEIAKQHNNSTKTVLLVLLSIMHWQFFVSSDLIKLYLLDFDRYHCPGHEMTEIKRCTKIIIVLSICICIHKCFVKVLSGLYGFWNYLDFGK